MAISKLAEEAFHQAIEAAYAMQEPGVTVEDRKLAEKAYKHHMGEYYDLSRNTDDGGNVICTERTTQGDDCAIEGSTTHL